MDGIVYDLNRICRTCRNEASVLRSVRDECQISNESARIDEMLMACTAVQVKSEDGLPSQICDKCAEQLKHAYTFKQLCQESDVHFRGYVKNIRDKEIKLQEIKEELNSTDIGIEPLDKFLEHNSAKDEEGETRLEKTSDNSDFIEFLDNNQMILTCRECTKVFTTLDGLRSHKRIHLGTLFKCKYCEKRYTRQTHVYRHELSHGKHKLHVCRICNKTLTRIEHLKRHLTTHLKEKPYTCKSCNRGFNRSDHLDVHAVRCKGDRIHICDICNRGFIREDSLIVHKKLHENQKPVLPTLDNIDNIEEHYYEIDHDPNLDFDVASDLEDYWEPHVEVTENMDEEHIRDVYEQTNDNGLEDDEKEMIENVNYDLNNESHKDDISDKDDMDYEDNPTDIPPDDDSDSVHSEYLPTKVSPKVKRGRGRPRKNPFSTIKSTRPRGRPPGVKKEQPGHDNENEETSGFPCPECKEVFPKFSLLDRHARQHDGLKVHSCKICNKQFSRYSHLKRHLTSHSILKPYTCEQCNKSFNRRDHLNQHVRLHYKKQPEFDCDMCMKSFNRTDQLAKHKASKHSVGEKVMSEKKYECHVCMKSFTTEKYRDVHVKGHMGEKKFKCKTCDKSFLSKSHLTEHVKFHNEHSKKFLCSECGQRFIRNDYLVIHMRRHRGEKPFKCKYCGKGFPRTTDLTVHERYHTGEKTHLCTICGRGFGRAYNLTVHMRTHTGEKPYQCTYCDAAFAQGNDLKAHVRRHTGERFQCELCTESFLMGYLLTQHKRTVHGLNVVSNIRRLQPVTKIKQDTEEPPPITIPLPKPVVPDIIIHNIQAHINAQFPQQLGE